MKFFYFLLAYLFGSVPFGYLLFRITERKDIRRFGSQSMGATNVLRLKGWKFALPVALLDVVKGALPVLLALHIFPGSRVVLAAAFFSVLGHCYPVYIRFRGGKGVATSMGAYAVLAFGPFLGALAIFIGVIGLTRYVSLGSILASFSFPFLAYLMKEDGELFLASLAIFAVVFIRHGSNVKRLFRGKERKLGQKEGIEK